MSISGRTVSDGCLGDTTSLKGATPPREYSSYKAHMKFYSVETWQIPMTLGQFMTSTGYRADVFPLGINKWKHFLHHSQHLN